ncbi:MAG: type IV pilus assembly protein PilE [Alloalcanivorax sp.]|mgnify:CR=1 FL=1|jgi:type IV pilus assembly protein PilE|nr:prepilin-type N-terminal cleavage/methylation domain-containing protein [Alcanivorax sp.]HIK75329.1 prepilin-type N-terminal cleavage/methylation domain-containing protein [Alcanivorax sp.]
MVSQYKKIQGFTLIELMIVVVVVAILAAIAYPSYTEQVRETRRAEYQGLIMDLAASLENYRARNFSYKDADSALGSLSPKLNNNDYYSVNINVSADNQRYDISAAPKGAQSGDGTLKLNSEGVTCHVKGAACTLNGSNGWSD